MAVEYLPYENLLIPILGLCILLPLSIAVLFEPKRDYSRKIYIYMLFWCAGILCTEALQWIFMDKITSSTDILFFRIIDFLFFIFLVLICYTWTIYSYYWFNEIPPALKIKLGFFFGPIVEFTTLIVNLFTGSVYLINSKGEYSRGPLFIFFIGFCYCYLILAISITAFFTIKNDKKNHKQDFLLFLLFFIFPVIGPLFQYLFPDISVMGISEAIALLTVFVSVQQRINSEYAVEKAKYQEENSKYDKSLEELLSASSDALIFFHLNLTQNICPEAKGTSVFVKSILHGKSVNDVFNSIAEVITNKKEEAEFRTIFNRDHLLELFSEDKSKLSLCFHRRIDGGESHYIKAYLNMLKNPSSGDIEAIAYSVDIDRQEKEEKVLSAITNREYDYIALIDASSKKIHYQYMSQKIGKSILLSMGAYDTVMKSIFDAMSEENKAQVEFDKIAFITVFNYLQQQEEYSYTFQFINSQNEIQQKRVTFRYLDENKNEILFF